MSFYNLVLTATRSNNTLQNAFQYETTSLLASSEEAGALIQSVITNVLPAIRAIVATTTLFQSIYVIAPYAPDVFSQHNFAPPGLAGIRAGDPMPNFAAWGFICTRTRRDIRNGYKRFGLVSESDVTAQAPTAGMITILNACADALKAPLTLTGSFGTHGAQPIIVKRIKVVDPETEKVSYRLPQGTDPFVFYEATGWKFDDITTQSSRKPGRGI